jgi:signal transduction histidine kinase
VKSPITKAAAETVILRLQETKAESGGPPIQKNAQDTTANADDSGKDALKPCRILGFATSHASSVNEEFAGDRQIAMSEPFLAGLLRRYPWGKIFNFFEDGSISASETSDSNFQNFFQRSGDQINSESVSRRPNRRYKRTRKAILRQDAETLLQLAPDSRSIVFSPLWDSHKSRWYSASVAGARSPHRVFTSDEELSFLFAFGNSMMAEVHRLDALFSEQAKSSLLAGLSHELRSPLHGIFGMAGLLNASVMNSLQRGVVHTISSCAFTLLGSINQLLEYASIKEVPTRINC